MIIISLTAFVFKAFIIASLVAGLISSISTRTPQSAIVREDRPTGAELPLVVAASDATLPMDNACDEFDTPIIALDSMTVAQLKALCRERGVKRYSSLRKAQLVDLLLAT